MPERDPSQQHEKAHSHEKANDHYERSRQSAESKAEKSPDQKHSAEIARDIVDHEALNKEELIKHDSPDKEARNQVFLTSQVRRQSFNSTMRSVRKKLPKVEATFSKVIHNNTIDKVSEIASETVGRPSAIFGGSIAAFLGLLIIYWFARRNGFQLSGYEFILLMITGMLAGIVVEICFTLFKKIISKRR